MGDFATMDDLVAGLANTATYGCNSFYKKTSITTVSTYYYSSWQMPGFPLPATTFPTTQALCNKGDAGSLAPSLVDAPAGGTNRMLNWGNLSTGGGMVTLYDRIAHMGGLGMTTTTAQTVNLDTTAANTAGRCALDGSDIEWFLEVFTAGGATSPGTVTISYTNQAGTSGRSTTVPVMASMFPAYKVIPITTLQSGDSSIKSIQTITLAASTLTAGNLGVVFAKRITPSFQYNSATAVTSDFAALGMPKVPANACIWMLLYSTAAASGINDGQIIIGSHA